MHNEAIDPITKTEAEAMREFGMRNLYTARHIAATMYPIPLEIVCFHCQQAAEMLVKAVLLMYDIEPQKTNMVNQLLELLEDVGFKIPEEIYRQCSDLSPFATKFRYPSPIEIEKHHMEQALKYAHNVLEWCETFWK